MKRNKITYITDLSPAIRADRNLLYDWAKNSVDMVFLELSVDILSDVGLLYRWDCDNILNINLSSWLLTEEEKKPRFDFYNNISQDTNAILKPKIYKMIITELMSSKLSLDIVKKDLVQQGHSIESIEKQERLLKARSLLNSLEQTNHYSVEELAHYFNKVTPELIKENKKVEKEYFKKKTNKLINTDRKIIKRNQPYENEMWFKIGVLIATGEMESLLKLHISASKVAQHLNMESSRPYITDSIYNRGNDGLQYVKRNTNIYNDHNKLLKIHQHCIKNSLLITENFNKICERIDSF